jgi:hypothetical protein
VPILLQKSFLSDERNFLGPLLRFVCGDVRALIVSHKTPETFASALQSVAAVEASKNPLWRIFLYGSIFDFCNNICQNRTYVLTATSV